MDDHYRNRVRCRDCRYFEDYSREDFNIVEQVYQCSSKKTAQWNPVDGWIGDQQLKDPFVLNKDGDCRWFERP